MATTAYLGPKYAPTHLGFPEMLGDAFKEAAARDYQQQRAAGLEKVLTSMAGAGSRDKALEAMRMATPYLSKPEDINILYKFVDEKYPQSDSTPTEVTAYGPNAEERKLFVPKGHLQAFGDPQLQSHEAFAGMPEEERGKWSLTKPAAGSKKSFYREGPGGEIEYTGDFTPDKAPSGAKEKGALEIERSGRRERREEQRLDLAYEANERNNARMNALLNRLAGQGDKAAATEARQGWNDARSYLLTFANPKRSFNALGELEISFDKPEDQSKYERATSRYLDLAERGMNPQRAQVQAAREIYGTGAKADKTDKTPAGEMPQAAKDNLLKQLKDGEQATLANGQKWKKEKGKLVKVQ